MRYGFVKVAAAVPKLKVAACSYNTDEIIRMVSEAENAGVELIVFPELSITAYTCGDLIQQEQLLRDAITGLGKVLKALKDLRITAIVGLPLLVDNQLFNCAAVLHRGEILGIVPKTYIPGYSEFSEERWFASGRNTHSPYVVVLGKKVPFGTNLLFESCIDRLAGGPEYAVAGGSKYAVAGGPEYAGADGSKYAVAGGPEYAGAGGVCFGVASGPEYAGAGGSKYAVACGPEYAGAGGVCFGVEICEDLWTPVPPSSCLAAAGAYVIFNLSASNESIGKAEYRRELVKQQSRKCLAGYVYTSSGVYESTTDVVFGGHALITENGSVLVEGERYRRDSHMIISEIDIQRLMSNRIKNTSFMDGVSEHSYRKIPYVVINELETEGTGSKASKSAGSKLTRYIASHPFVPSDKQERDNRCKEIYAIQTAGLAKRLEHTGIKKVVLGVSGGLDSTLAFIVAVKTFDMLGIPRKNIIAITMPGFGTTDNTYENALQLINSFGAELREIDIKKACLQHYEDIGHNPKEHDITYENVQARERTQILMDIANKINGLVIGTGSLSELALGWCTYNGDHMSMYSVNCGIPKTLVRHLVQWTGDNMKDMAVADVLARILDTPISPELLPPDDKGKIKQKTEDSIGPYELHDFFIYHMLRYGAPPKKLLYLAEYAFDGKYDRQTIKSWLKVFIKRFFSQQFKRSCLPDGPKVGSISLSPRGDWRMPSDASAEVWLKEIE